MKCNINNTPLKISSIPRVWNGIRNYQNATDRHFDDGWRDVVNPAYDSAIEKLGGLIISGNQVTYEVIALNQSEIDQKIKLGLANQKQATIQAKFSKKVINEAQALTNDEDILANNVMYPFWGDFEDGTNFPTDMKINRLIDGSIRTFKVIKSHNKQYDCLPENTPDLFTEIVISGGIEV